MGAGEPRETVESSSPPQGNLQAAVEVPAVGRCQPMADMVKKGYEAMQPATKTAKKEKAAV
jgi:hypothetical protein